MVNRTSHKFEEINDWFYFNRDKIIAILMVIVVGLSYWFFTRLNRQIDLTSYNTEVQLVQLEYEKIYALPAIYSTKRELDKIIFELEYWHNNEIYHSKAVVFWEYVTPKLERIIDNQALEKLTIRCKKDAPEKVMLFVKRGVGE